MLQFSTFIAPRKFYVVFSIDDYQGDMQVLLVVALFGRAFKVKKMFWNYYCPHPKNANRWPQPYEYRTYADR